MPTPAWKQLTVDYNPDIDPFNKLVPEFWGNANSALEQEGVSMDVPEIDDIPLFHVRRTPNNSKHPPSIELFRLNSNASNRFSRLCEVVNKALPSDVEFRITNLRWSPPVGLNQSNRFFTFIQACTILRLKRNIHAPDNLAHYNNRVQALAVMRNPNQPWATDLAPWFRHLDIMSCCHSYCHDNELDYAHWFGHILSE